MSKKIEELQAMNRRHFEEAKRHFDELSVYQQEVEGLWKSGRSAGKELYGKLQERDYWRNAMRFATSFERILPEIKAWADEEVRTHRESEGWVFWDRLCDHFGLSDFNAWQLDLHRIMVAQILDELRGVQHVYGY